MAAKEDFECRYENND